jgi:tRNA threonylcarbamoyladenosine biosynthesis protein TsaE
MTPDEPSLGNEAATSRAAQAPVVESLIFTSRTERETEALGEALAGVVEPGMVVALIGPLGAGKTRLVTATAAALGVDRREVSSPTFVLIQEYAGRFPVYHFDAYRLRGVDEFLALGADEILGATGVCFVEWADKLAGALPSDAIRVEITISGTATREFRISGAGARPSRAIAALRSRVEGFQ